ncbi:hypothetical protein GCM10022216_14240 [Sphingobacterium kyonggiense]|uniref:Uncharacterized protein n=1 Tax=Sphingobacterium kyonggiense TaxID=714075 RepID=A0ABP7YL37_9SPHI
MEGINLFLSPFILAFGVFLIGEKNRKFNKALGVLLIAVGGYLFIDSVLFLIKLFSSIYGTGEYS